MIPFFFVALFFVFFFCLFLSKVQVVSGTRGYPRDELACTRVQTLMYTHIYTYTYIYIYTYVCVYLSVCVSMRVRV